MNILSWFASLLSKPTPPRPDNTGIVIGPHEGASDPNAYVAGVNSQVPYTVQMASGNWAPFCWSRNKQWSIKNGQYYDTLACTVHALLTAIETQENFMTGRQVKYSRRWVAKMSGTNQGKMKGIGNYMDVPAEWVRKNGLVLESSYPTPDTYTTDEFYADIPVGKLDELAREGQEWLKTRRIAYEFLQVSDPNLDLHLKQAPITVAVPGHDICGLYSPDDLMRYRDSYEPWDKTTPILNLQAALKIVLYDTRIIMRQIGWQDAEKGIYVGFDTPARQQAFFSAMAKLFPDYRLEGNKEHNLGKRPWG